MIVPFDVVVVICLAYVAALFLIAWVAERRANAGRLGILRSPLVYTLSLSVYCTAWTYYGAVGSAARNGMEFVAIYLGPTLVFVGWWWVLRRLVRVGRAQRVTSIADLISSRYGKSAMLGVLVTVLAVIGATPYIALQLQSLTLSFSALAGADAGDPSQVSFWIAAGLALFTIVFGTRNLDANERHHGVVTAIAVEAVVKLFALLAVGVFVVWGVASGPADIISRLDPEMLKEGEVFSARWVTLILLSSAAIICLPRMFQVMVVENVDERHLATASWAFPLYLFLMSLFVVPIAVAGLSVLPEGANPDLFVLTVPLSQNQGALALLAFLGGFSAATSMVIVAAIALSTMVSNHIVMPLWLRLGQSGEPASDDVKTLLLQSRRLSIAGVIFLGFLYFRLSGGSTALASMGLIAFLGVAQVLPALLGGLFWRGATRSGARAGIIVGFALWAYTLLLPSLGLIDGAPFGWTALSPQALLGLSVADPLIHAATWSLGANAIVFIAASTFSFPTPMERLQGLQFRDMTGGATGRVVSRNATAEELLVLAQRILGRDAGMALFNETAAEQGKESGLPDPTDDFVQRLEREFAGSVGAAAAHAMVGQVAGGEAVSVRDLIAVADETAEIMESSARLKTQSEELERTARELRAANHKLTELSAQKDAFLSQVSHELRTPMTSIRSFAEILRDVDAMDDARRARYSSIIHDESLRLTRLLDDILDLSFLESGRIQLNVERRRLGEVIDRAIDATEALCSEHGVTVRRNRAAELVEVETDPDRLAQVFINLIGNSAKYGKGPRREVRIDVAERGKRLQIDVIDDGPGVARADRAIIFEKFAKLARDGASGSAGLGLPISREIMRNLGGGLDYVGGGTGAIFRLRLPLDIAAAPRIAASPIS